MTKSSCLLLLNPIVDQAGVGGVGGRIQNAQFCYSVRHPAVLHGKHQVTKLIIYSKHLCLLHARPTLVAASLSRRYHIIGSRKAVYSVTHGCITCRRTSARPQPQMLGQLPPERLMPGPVFENVGVDYAGPVYIKYGFVRKPTTVKAYVCVFVALSVKAVHLELVSDLTTEAFIATLAVDRLPFGAIMALTLLVLLVKSRNSFKNKGHKEPFQSFVLHRISNGTNVLLTSVVSGKQL